jgi:hypothetical protein
MQIVEASRDLSALGRYLPLFIGQAASQAESGLAARRIALRRAAAINPARLESLKKPSASIPYAFELWIAHLGWLDQVGASIDFTLDDLRPEEADGLALLRHARERFWREHSACPQCQSVNIRAANFCGGCGTQFGGTG